MGLVLAFETAPRPARRTPPQRPESPQTADILFFTGVRYERRAGIAGPEPRSQPEAPAGGHPAS